VDQSSKWITQTSGSLKQVGHSNKLITQTSGSLKQVDHSSKWVTQTSGSLKQVDHSNKWITQTSGSLKQVDHPTVSLWLFLSLQRLTFANYSLIPVENTPNPFFHRKLKLVSWVSK
jgi:Cu/Ag efflux protein CusF